MHIEKAPAFGEIAFGVDDPLALSELFGEYVKQFGADCFAYTLLTSATLPDPLRTVANMPDGWVDRYFERAYAEVDPQFAAMRESARPFLWSRSLDGRNVERRCARFLREAAAFGLRDAISFGIPGLKGLDAAMAVTAVSSTALASTFDERLQPLHVAVLEFHLMIRSLLDRRNNAVRDWRLTGRERECYQWIARGKSSWEIGQILGISERTVVFHIDNVKRKLNVGSRIQALVKLVLVSEIEP